MIAYIVRRLLHGVGIVLGVLGLLFILFFAVTSPEGMATKALGEKAPPEAIAQWVTNHGYDRPLFWNPEEWSDTLLVDHYTSMLSFDFGRSDADDRPIMDRIKQGAKPSLYLTVPLFLIGMFLSLSGAMLVAFFRGTFIDKAGLVVSVLAMSIPTMVYIIAGQYILGKVLLWFPISGFDRDPSMVWKFLMLPIIVGMIESLGGGVRFYRTVFLEESNRDYVRTARAKGCGELGLMTNHVLGNAMIPLLTQVVVASPHLFLGALLTESFFGIPGLGAAMVEAIHGNDFSTLRALVFIGCLLFIVAQIVTDIAYTVVDPRVRLK
jgi:peptide/nickel transport system permease protein